jgi:response regulator RpfG family c-di-GMP phosphodiesterase
MANSTQISQNMQSQDAQTEDSSVRLSSIISALSYALDLTEGQPMGHSVRSCMIGMRIAEQMGLGVQERADLYYALLLKDAGCSSNASRLFHILNADEIRAKGDVKTTDWTRVGYESLHYALSHVGTGMPFLQRMQKLFQVAATQQQDSCSLVKIRCERGSHIAKELGFSESVSAGIYNLDEHWNGRGYPDGLRKNRDTTFFTNRESVTNPRCFLHGAGIESCSGSRAKTQRLLVRS